MPRDVAGMYSHDGLGWYRSYVSEITASSTAEMMLIPLCFDSFLGPPGVRRLLLIRGICGFGSTLLLYLALQHLSLSDATTITFLGPMLIASMGSCLLGETLSWKQTTAGLISFAGVVLIARPSAIFGSDEGGTTPEGTAKERYISVLLELTGVLLTAIAWISLRTIGNRCSTYHSIAYFSLVSWVSSFALMLVTGAPFVLPSSAESSLLLLLVGVYSLGAQVFQTLGLQRETAGRAASVTYIQILFATLWQMTVLHAGFDWLSAVGSAIIVSCGLWIAISQEPSVIAH